MSESIAIQKREQIIALEEAMKELPQIEISVFHYFAKGLYAREVRIPKGALCVGKIHRHEHLNILISGKIRIQSEDADIVVEAPATFVASAGVKKVLFAIENTVFMNVLATDITDIEEIDKAHVCDTYEELKQQLPWHL